MTSTSTASSPAPRGVPSPPPRNTRALALPLQLPLGSRHEFTGLPLGAVDGVAVVHGAPSPAPLRALLGLDVAHETPVAGTVQYGGSAGRI